MPIYEYRCESCGQELEKLQKISDPPLTDCPACGKAALKKLVSASSFRLKGTGWYETDFKDKKKTKSGAGQEGGSEKSGEANSPGDPASGKTADSGNSDKQKQEKKKPANSE